MSAGKNRRARYRQMYARGEHADPLAERLAAVGGTAPCALCTLAKPLVDLDEGGVCAWCRSAGGSVTADRGRPLRENVVCVDASFWKSDARAHGRAALAIVGALGEHTKIVAVTKATEAEVEALRWALAIACERDMTDLVFRTDCQAVVRQLGETVQRLGWTLEQVPRHRNWAADWLASQARQNWQRAQEAA
jgi:ribonuclease HI